MESCCQPSGGGGTACSLQTDIFRWLGKEWGQCGPALQACQRKRERCRHHSSPVPESGAIKCDGVVLNHPADFTRCIGATSMKVDKLGVCEHAVRPAVRMHPYWREIAATRMHAGVPRMDKIGINSEQVGDKFVMPFDLFDGFCRASKFFDPPIFYMGQGGAVQCCVVWGVNLATCCREISAQGDLAGE